MKYYTTCGQNVNPTKKFSFGWFIFKLSLDHWWGSLRYILDSLKEENLPYLSWTSIREQT